MRFGINLDGGALILRYQWPGMPNKDSRRTVELFGREVLPRFGRPC